MGGPDRRRVTGDSADWSWSSLDTAARYRVFADRDAARWSPMYRRLALAVADDPDLVGRLDTLPEPKRQPLLLFAAVRYLGGPVGDPGAFRDWVTSRWDTVSDTVRRHRTQTNEPARCATLLPALARLPEPLALLEVGASAGLCLFPDRYRYRFGDRELGPADGPVVIDCAVDGDVPVPDRVPKVVWRAGLDLNPLDTTSPEDRRWLEALIWPEQHHRVARLRAAARIAEADPPTLVRGDLLADLPALAARAPADATLVVFHSAVLAYVPPEIRTAFARLVSGLPGHWIANEAPGAVPGVRVSAPDDGSLVLAVDGRPLAFTGPHGQYLRGL